MAEAPRPRLSQPVRERVALATYTTLGVGGPARYLAPAEGPEDLECLADWAEERGLARLVLGHGSNVLVSDGGFEGLVIVNRRRLDAGEPETQPAVPADQGEPALTLDAGAALAGVARWAAGAGLAGLEWAGSMPGTAGGALVGNAGAFGGSMADVVVAAEVRRRGGGRQTLAGPELGLRYRGSALSESDDIVLWVMLRLAEDDAEACRRRLAEYARRRQASQPAERSAGSVFRNPPGQSAGALIDGCGLKGAVVGDAMVSDRHANFIVNRGRARAGDVVALVNRVRRVVYESRGVILEPELRLVGDIRLEEL